MCSGTCGGFISQRDASSDIPHVVFIPPGLYAAGLVVGFVLNWIAPRPIVSSSAVCGAYPGVRRHRAARERVLGLGAGRPDIARAALRDRAPRGALPRGQVW